MIKFEEKKIIDYGNDKRILLKKYGKWSVTLSYDGVGFYPNNIMIDDGYISYYMNENCCYDNPYPIPKGLRKWLEKTGIKYLKKYNELRNIQLLEKNY